MERPAFPLQIELKKKFLFFFSSFSFVCVHILLDVLLFLCSICMLVRFSVLCLLICFVFAAIIKTLSACRRLKHEDA